MFFGFRRFPNGDFVDFTCLPGFSRFIKFKIMENSDAGLRFIEEGSAKIYEQGHVFYNPVQEV